jgi:NTE family protein
VAKIGIAFGSGGARGMAHILMVEALEELGLKPSVISGTSIGAVIGAFYAAGFSSAEMKEIFYKLIYPKRDSFFDFLWRSDIMKMFTMFDPQFVKSGFIKGEKFQNFLQSQLNISTFEQLKIPLKIITTDYWNKTEIIFEKGKLLPAIRASYSLPGLFTPTKVQNKILVDGGIVNPLPYDVLMNDCDYTIAIDVTAYKTHNGKEYPPTFESVFTAYQIMQHSISQQKIKFIKPDIYIRPEIEDVKVFDFSKVDSIFEQAKPAKEQLKRKLEHLLKYKTTTEYVGIVNN